jgi:hypothetical protein
MCCGTAATATHTQSRWNIRSRFQAFPRKRQRAVCRSSEISGLTMSRAVNVAITCSALRLRTLSILCLGFRFAMAPLLNVLHTCSITLCGNLLAYLRTTFFFLFFLARSMDITTYIWVWLGVLVLGHRFHTIPFFFRLTHGTINHGIIIYLDT